MRIREIAQTRVALRVSDDPLAVGWGPSATKIDTSEYRRKNDILHTFVRHLRFGEALTYIAAENLVCSRGHNREAGVSPAWPHGCNQ